MYINYLDLGTYTTFLHHPQILVFPIRGNNDQSYVAIDPFEFLALLHAILSPKLVSSALPGNYYSTASNF